MSVALHYSVDGPEDAPVVLFGSSLGTTGAMWQPQVAELSREFRLVRFDHRGHGKSPVPPGPYSIADLGGDVVALLDTLGVEKASYAGLSLGGMVGMWLAANAPDRIDRLALLCTSAQLGPASNWETRAATVRADGMAAIADAVVARWFTDEFHQNRADVVAEFRAMLTSTDRHGYAACCEAIGAMDLRDELPRITAPTLVVAAAADTSTPVPHAEEIVRRIPDAVLAVVDDAAHIANVEQPERVTTLLAHHLRAGEPADDAARRHAGMCVRRAVLGDEHVDHAIANTTALTADFQDFITRYAWGDIWTRPGLDRRTRSSITIAMLAALQHEGELGMHLTAGLRNGLTREEILEILLQVGVYAGVPTANRAFAIAQKVLRDESDPSS